MNDNGRLVSLEKEGYDRISERDYLWGSEVHDGYMVPKMGLFVEEECRNSFAGELDDLRTSVMFEAVIICVV